MPYKKLKNLETDDGLDNWRHVVEGDFSEMLYLCADVFNDKMEGDNFVSKSQEELTKDYRDQLQALFLAVGPFMDNGYVKKYYFVLTPNVCDSRLLEYSRPKVKNNFIVMPFNYEEIQLVEKVIVPSGVAGGTIRKSDDRSKRAATNSSLDAYVALVINSEHPDYSGWKEHGRDSDQFDRAVYSISLLLGDAAASYLKTPLRTFMKLRSRQENGRREPVFVEQYFDNEAKKTKDYALGEGYVRGAWRNLKPGSINKYIAAPDLFNSTGSEFCRYGLSSEELNEYKLEFRANPWVSIEYDDEG